MATRIKEKYLAEAVPALQKQIAKGLQFTATNFK